MIDPNTITPDRPNADRILRPLIAWASAVPGRRIALEHGQDGKWTATLESRATCRGGDGWDALAQIGQVAIAIGDFEVSP